MKTNNTKKNSATKKLIPAVSMLTVSAMMLSTATYAWFTMNKTVKVDGMEVKTKVSGNLMISDTNQSDAYYGTTLVQGRKALLEPVSSTTGANGSFWYTVDAKADGSKLHANTGDNVFKNYSEATNAALDAATSYKTYYDQTFNTTYQLTPTSDPFGTGYGYIDYVFYLKATGDGTDTKINMTRCNLDRSDAIIDNSGKTVGVDSDQAWRVAVFATTTTAGSAAGDPASDAENLKGSILALNGATYHDSGAVTSAAGGYASAGINSSGVYIGEVAAGATAYYKVTVRLWLEGQDKTCNSATYALLKDDSWKLDLQFDMQSTAGGVQAIGSEARPNPALVDDVPDVT